LLSKEETVSLPKAISSGQKLGEGSAGVSFKIFFRGELVIYKQFKSDLTSDGRIESEIALAAKNKGEEVLQEVVGITINPIGVMYKLRSNQLEFEAVAGPPSFESCECGFVLFCFVLFCFVLFCFVLFCFVLFCFVLLCFALFVCLFHFDLIALLE
jgi:hypothetical protein